MVVTGRTFIAGRLLREQRARGHHVKGGTGIYIVHSDHFPPSSFEIQFFSPTNKFAAGGAKFIAQKDAF